VKFGVAVNGALGRYVRVIARNADSLVTCKLLIVRPSGYDMEGFQVMRADPGDRAV
jgi:hypothetical protein